MQSGEHKKRASHRWDILTNVETTSDEQIMSLRLLVVAQLFLIIDGTSTWTIGRM